MHIFYIFGFILSFLAFHGSGEPLQFKPGNASTFETPALPAAFNIPQSQLTYPLDPPGSSSYWSTSFITASDQHQYLIVSHVLLMSSGPVPVARCSILDITNTTHYWMRSVNVSLATNTSTQSVLDLDYGSIGMQGLSADSTAIMRTWASFPNFGFNITWDSSSKVLLNGGSGMFAYGTGNTHEWSMPAGRTTGTLTLDGKGELAIDTEHSLTWYDRQWGYSAPIGGNWTWFELHFADTETKASIWAIDQPGESHKRFASVRTEIGTHVVPFELLPDWSRTWMSPCSGETYPLAWTLEFGAAGTLSIESGRDDQELCEIGQLPAYEGFVKVNGTLLGRTAAFGLVEMVYT